MEENKELKKNEKLEPDNGGRETEPKSLEVDNIDRDLEQSFPASDPPGWTLGIGRDIY